MDTQTCGICKRTADEDNPVESMNVGAAEPKLVCVMCCEEIVALLDLLDVLK